jgi:hypothetical protein
VIKIHREKIANGMFNKWLKRYLEFGEEGLESYFNEVYNYEI